MSAVLQRTPIIQHVPLIHRQSTSVSSILRNHLFSFLFQRYTSSATILSFPRTRHSISLQHSSEMDLGEKEAANVNSNPNHKTDSVPVFENNNMAPREEWKESRSGRRKKYLFIPRTNKYVGTSKHRDAVMTRLSKLEPGKENKEKIRDEVIGLFLRHLSNVPKTSWEKVDSARVATTGKKNDFVTLTFDHCQTLYSILQNEGLFDNEEVLFLFCRAVMTSTISGLFLNLQKSSTSTDENQGKVDAWQSIKRSPKIFAFHEQQRQKLVLDLLHDASRSRQLSEQFCVDLGSECLERGWMDVVEQILKLGENHISHSPQLVHLHFRWLFRQQSDSQKILEAWDHLIVNSSVQPDRSIFHIVIRSLITAGDVNSARDILRIMSRSNSPPDSSTALVLVKAVTLLRSSAISVPEIVLIEQSFASNAEWKHLRKDKEFLDAMMALYAERRSIDKTLQFLQYFNVSRNTVIQRLLASGTDRSEIQSSPKPTLDVVSYGHLMRAFVHVGRKDIAMDIYNEACELFTNPGRVLNRLYLQILPREGKIEETFQILETLDHGATKSKPTTNSNELPIRTIAERDGVVGVIRALRNMIRNGEWVTESFVVALLKGMIALGKDQLRRDHLYDFRKLLTLFEETGTRFGIQHFEVSLLVKSNFDKLTRGTFGVNDKFIKAVDSQSSTFTRLSRQLYFNMLAHHIARHKKIPISILDEFLKIHVYDKGLTPSEGEIASLIYTHCARKDVNAALDVIAHAVEFGVRIDDGHFNMIMGCYIALKKLQEAREVFERMMTAGIPITTVQPYITLAHSYALEGKVEEVYKIVEQASQNTNIVPEKCASDFLSVIHNAYMSQPSPIKAQEAVSESLDRGLRPKYRLLFTIPQGVTSMKWAIGRAEHYAANKSAFDRLSQRTIMEAAELAKKNHAVIKERYEEDQKAFDHDLQKLIQFVKDLHLPTIDQDTRKEVKEEATKEILNWLNQVESQVYSTRGSLF